MFTGTEATVKLRCANHLADVILEQFGKDTMLIQMEDDFTVSVPVQISKPFYAWVAGFGADMNSCSRRQSWMKCGISFRSLRKSIRSWEDVKTPSICLLLLLDDKKMIS